MAANQINVERLVWADSLKGILILLVVLGHAIQECLGEKAFANHLWNYIYSFHMPAFMAVSGYLSYRLGNQVNLRSIIWRRFRQLVVPFILWTTINKCIHGTFTISSLWEIIKEPTKGLWFLWILFIISVVFNFGVWISNRANIQQEIIHGFIGIILVIFMSFYGIKIFGFQLVAYFFLFYIIGYYTRKYQVKIVIYSKPLLLFLLVCWLILGWFWTINSVPKVLVSIPVPSVILNYLYRFMTAIIVVYLLIAFFPKHLNYRNSWNNVLCFCGRISLGIYTVHLIGIGTLFSIINTLPFNDTIKICATFIVGGGISCILVWLLSNNAVTAKWLLGKL